ncbi:unnamed protein product [Allacma fusca]|uniref:Uncharacterized protein n=1 Tax=Allacma fusca TaxID=39272 RepID=A0A8J2JXW9_9HEXA|nr:unnamed protein product [Allacma fusca]
MVKYLEKAVQLQDPLRTLCDNNVIFQCFYTGTLVLDWEDNAEMKMSYRGGTYHKNKPQPPASIEKDKLYMLGKGANLLTNIGGSHRMPGR